MTGVQKAETPEDRNQHAVHGFTVVPGDVFKAQRTNGAPYLAHRYYGFAVRTGTWGYVDQSKLKFLTQTCL